MCKALGWEGIRALKDSYCGYSEVGIGEGGRGGEQASWSLKAMLGSSPWSEGQDPGVSRPSN